MTAEKRKPGKKAAGVAGEKTSGGSRKGSRAVLNFTDLEERDLALEKSTIQSLDSEAKKLSKKGRKISQDSVLANIALHDAGSLKFKAVKIEKSKMKFTLPAGIWELLDDAAKRNKSSLEETIDYLIKKL